MAFSKIQSFLLRELSNNIMKRKKKLIQFIIKKGLMIIWTGNSIYVLMIFALMSCKSDNHWELPSDSSSIDQVIDSILIKHEKEISKDLLNFKIDVSKNYTLRGNIKNDLKIGWWVFNGINDSIKIDYLNLDNESFKNQIIFYDKGTIDRNRSKFYKVRRNTYNKDSLNYRIYYFVPMLSKNNQDYKIFYGLTKGKNILLKNESFGKVKDEFIQFDIIIPSYKMCDDCIFKMMLTQTVYVESEERIIINHSFISDTIKQK